EAWRRYDSACPRRRYERGRDRRPDPNRGHTRENPKHPREIGLRIRDEEKQRWDVRRPHQRKQAGGAHPTAVLDAREQRDDPDRERDAEKEESRGRHLTSARRAG